MFDFDLTRADPGIPRAQDALKAMMNLFTTPCPVSVYKYSINTGPSSFFGEKYKGEKVRQKLECGPEIESLCFIFGSGPGRRWKSCFFH